jgi:hypothetical protein
VPEFTQFVAPLFEGPLDIVGDIHGEIAALDSLLAELGYAEDGRHPGNRRLVFLGDLVDRGPDSPAVLRKVRDLVHAGVAQCILGNHELNLLINDEKYDNSWWTAPEKSTKHPAVPIDPDEKVELANFLSKLPLVLERSDLRVVHACWHPESISLVREAKAEDIVQLYNMFAEQSNQHMRDQGLFRAVGEEWRTVSPRIDDPDWKPVYMPAKAAMDSHLQMDNPVAVLTSGAEQPAKQPFWAGGKWRMTDRVRWWDTYMETPIVVMGHYWRRFGEARIYLNDKYGPDLFAGIGPHHWMGQKENVYCVDFSVGARAEQRAQGQDEFACKLAALRTPEWEVVHDDGVRAPLEK